MISCSFGATFVLGMLLSPNDQFHRYQAILDPIHDAATVHHLAGSL